MNKNQNVRRVLSLLFVMVMLVSMMVVGTVTASAEEAETVASANVAKNVNTGEEYASLQTAIDKAVAGNEIVLLSDFNGNVKISGKKITLNGDGKNYTGQITCEKGVNNQTVTIKNVNFVAGNILISNANANGDYEIIDCSFDGQNKINHCIQSARAHSITIKTTDPENPKTVKNYNYSFVYANLSTPSITMENMKISNVSYMIRVVSDGTFTFDNVTVTNANYGIVLDKGSKPTTVENCTFENVASPIYPNGAPTAGLTFVGTNDFGVEDLSFLNSFKSNNLVAQVGTSVYADIETAVENLEVGDQLVALNGKEIDFDEVNALLATTGKDFTVDENGVAKAKGVAQIGETVYETLAKALENANAGDIIYLLADVTEDVTIKKNNITINGSKAQVAGDEETEATDRYTFTGTVNINSVDVVTLQHINFVNSFVNGSTKNTSRKVTVQYCNFNGYKAGAIYAMHLCAASAAIIENVVADNCNTGLLYANSAISDLTLRNVKVSNSATIVNLSYPHKSLFENVTAVENVTYAIHLQNNYSGPITIRNCTFNSTYPIFVQNKGSHTVKFNLEGTNYFNTETLYNVTHVNLNLTAGATLAAPAGLEVNTTVANSCVWEADGVYTVAAHEYESEYTNPTFEADGFTTYTCKNECCGHNYVEVNEGSKLNAAASINGVMYATFKAAYEAAQTGDTIVLYETAVITGITRINKEITIDGSNLEVALHIKGLLTLVSDTTIKGNILIANGKVLEIYSNAHYGTISGDLSDLAIYGGTFNWNPAEYIAGNRAARDNKDGTFTVVDAVAKIGTVGYATFEDAYTAAQTGDTIVLLKTYVMTKNFTFDKDVTIDGSNLDVAMIISQSNGVSGDVVFNKGAFKGNVKIDGFVGLHVKNGCTFYGNFDLQYSMNLQAYIGSVFYGHALNEGSCATTAHFAAVTYDANGVPTSRVYKKVSLNASLALGSSINVNLSIVDADSISSQVKEGLAVYLVTANGNVELPYDENTGKFVFEGITAKQMTDTYKVIVLYNGNTSASYQLSFSVKAIAEKTIDAHPEYKTLLVALLNYGAEAQKSFDYNADNLANAGVKDETVTNVDLTKENNDYTDEDNSYYGASVNLKNELQFNFKFFADMVPGAVKAVVTIGNETITVYADDFGDNNGKKGNGRELVVVTVNVAAAQANEVMYCTFYDADGNAITTAGDSLLSYCVRAYAGLTDMKENNPNKYKDQTCKLEFYQALANYVVAAHGYATTENN